MFAAIRSLTLHYHLDGPPSGAPIVFINSLGCDLRTWDAVVPPLSARYRLVRYDKRGHGLSDAPPGPYTIRDHAEDLAGLLAGLGIEPVVLAGISVGGLIAMDFALQYPERVRGLILCDTAPKISTPELWNERIRAVRERGLGDMAEAIISRWFMPSFAQERPADYHGWLNMLARAPAEGYTATCAALRDADLRAALPTLSAPVMAICGAGDGVVTPAQTRAWAASLPSARVEIIEGAAHLPCIEQPGAVAAAIARFLKLVALREHRSAYSKGNFFPG